MPLSLPASPGLGCCGCWIEVSSFALHTYGIISAWSNCHLCGCWKPFSLYTLAANLNKTEQINQISWLKHSWCLCPQAQVLHIVPLLCCVTICTRISTGCTACTHRATVKVSGKLTQESRELSTVVPCMKDVHARTWARATPVCWLCVASDVTSKSGLRNNTISSSSYLRGKGMTHS